MRCVPNDINLTLNFLPAEVFPEFLAGFGHAVVLFGTAFYSIRMNSSKFFR